MRDQLLVVQRCAGGYENRTLQGKLVLFGGIPVGRKFIMIGLCPAAVDKRKVSLELRENPRASGTAPRSGNGLRKIPQLFADPVLMQSTSKRNAGFENKQAAAMRAQKSQ